MKTHTRVASAEDLEQVAMLFDKYRQFYAQPADLPLARQFMHARLSEGDSLVLVAEADGDRLGSPSCTRCLTPSAHAQASYSMIFTSTDQHVALVLPAPS